MQLVGLYDNENVAEIVKGDYRTAEVFKAYDINYCCAGNISLRDVCRQKNIVYADLLRKLNQVSQAINLPPDLQFHKWKTDFLIDYIINVHHAYLRQTMPQLERDLHEFVSRHPKKYLHIESLLALYDSIRILMINEYEEQENVLFPYIKQIYSAYRRRESYGSLFVRTLRKPVNMLNDGHKQLGEHLSELRRLAHNYHISEETCTGYNVLMKRLHELDNQIVLHKHLENNILFPSVLAMEQDLLKT